MSIDRSGHRGGLRTASSFVRTASTTAALLAGRKPTSGGAAVLAYHDVETTPSAHYSVTPQQLRDHLTLLRRSGREVVDLVVIVDRLQRGESCDDLAAVTFDDGLRGLHSHALELLRTAGIPATLFAVTDELGSCPDWVEGTGPLLSREQRREVHDAGVRIQSHTCRHPSLPRLDPIRQLEELRRSAELLEDEFGSRVELLAYPFGHHDGGVRQRVTEAGYRAAFTFLNGAVTTSTDMLRIPRLTMWHGVDRLRLASYLARRPSSWSDHQLESFRGVATGPPPTG
jgi:peptidoglycan/xylan/chitin deacetylase (PgdA/CDA1 family)